MSFWVNQSSLFKWLLHQNCLKINGFTAKITLIAMIKKVPLHFLDVNKLTSYDLIYVCTSEASQKWQGTISKKRRLFHWFSCNSEVEATWTSLIGWPHKTSNTYIAAYSCLLRERGTEVSPTERGLCLVEEHHLLALFSACMKILLAPHEAIHVFCQEISGRR